MASYPGHIPDSGGMNAFRLGQIATLNKLAARFNQTQTSDRASQTDCKQKQQPTNKN